jgi:multidrug efflux pump subunit AcrA (membrane-fusion protein)
MKRQKAEAELEEAKKNHAEALELRKEDLVAESEVKKAELKMREAQNALESAKMGHELLVKYTNPIELQRLCQAHEDAKESFDAIRPYMEALVSQKKAALSKAERALNELKERFGKKEKDLANCELLSPVEGIVNYGSPERSRFTYYGEDDGTLKAGSKVNVQRTLMYIPDLSTMYVELLIDETDVSKVKKGQLLTARVEAYPDLALDGVVEEVGLVGAESSWWDDAIKFKARCSIRQSHEGFRPDLKAKVEILVGELKGVVHVPLEAVFERDGKPVCYAADGAVRDVVTGQSTNDFVEIRSGLAPGDKVMLTAPEEPRRVP